MVGGNLEKGSVTVRNFLSPVARATQRTGARWPHEKSSSPVSTTHNFTVVSPDAVRSSCESSASEDVSARLNRNEKKERRLRKNSSLTCHVQRPHSTIVSPVCANALARVCVPDARRSVLAAAEQQIALSIVFQTRAGSLMSLQQNRSLLTSLIRQHEEREERAPLLGQSRGTTGNDIAKE